MPGIRDVARHLGISIGTVSRALNGKPDVNPQTRQLVQDAALRLGYAPNQSGRSLRKGTTGLLGILLPTDGEHTLVDAVFSSVLDALRRYVSANGLDLALFFYAEEEHPFAVLRNVVERRLVDGLVIANTLVDDPRIGCLLAKKVPFAAFGRSRTGGEFNWVDMDFADATDRSVSGLAAQGHRTISVVLPDRGFHYLDVIRNQFIKTSARLGLDLQTLRVIAETRAAHGGYIAGGRILAMAPRPTAVITSDRLLTVGLYKRLDEAGLRPRHDITVMALHCDAQAKFLSPALSHFQSDDLAIVGQKLGQALLASMEHFLDEPRGVQRHGFIQYLAPVAFIPGASADVPAETICPAELDRQREPCSR